MFWSKKKLSIDGSIKAKSDQGLRILTKMETSNSKVVVKPISLLKSKSYDCYLKVCNLCIKPLDLEKDIYMYKGDLGFCSEKCRERQIYMDETREMEANTQRILSGFRRRRCETTRRRHPPPRERVVFSYS
ncbi:hypothetical protein SASPL_149782 [Salvia splendens]|uniref:FLZ-type domain-containing protein n=1 Tax=Salvia splendens TaxID=180675 RepID=A0A8X8W513_SALSN|nr:hypothetical protein SASPL_149782 [Salvia splendens]